jgi:hypothetical protein
MNPIPWLIPGPVHAVIACLVLVIWLHRPRVRASRLARRSSVAARSGCASRAPSAGAAPSRRKMRAVSGSAFIASVRKPAIML